MKTSWDHVVEEHQAGLMVSTVSLVPEKCTHTPAKIEHDMFYIADVCDHGMITCDEVLEYLYSYR